MINPLICFPKGLWSPDSLAIMLWVGISIVKIVERCYCSFFVEKILESVNSLCMFNILLSVFQQCASLLVNENFPMLVWRYFNNNLVSTVPHLVKFSCVMSTSSILLKVL